jgi:uncharacterized damage-inducible protein DinB
MLWRTLPGVANSAGNLAVHVAGGLQHFIGGVLGGSGYVRDRDAEFSARGLSRTDVIAALDAAVLAVRALDALPEARLEEPFPAAPGGAVLSTRLFLLHLVGHTAFHLGQAGYLRRALTGQGASSGAMAVKELSAS